MDTTEQGIRERLKAGLYDGNWPAIEDIRTLLGLLNGAREENKALRELAEARDVLNMCYRTGILGSDRAAATIDRIRTAKEHLADLNVRL